jgi:hypothetical protein
MSSVSEQFQHKNQEKVYKKNITYLNFSKKTNIYELIREVELNKKNKKKSAFKFFASTTLLMSSVILFYSLY